MTAAFRRVHNVHVTAVNIAELRSHLSTYLNRARRGQEILVRHRNQPIARIVPVSGREDVNQELRELAAEGLLRLPEKKLNLKAFFALPAPAIPLKKLRAAIEAEREED